MHQRPLTKLLRQRGFMTCQHHLLEADVKPSRVVLTIQKEVAERICAKAGDLSIATTIPAIQPEEMLSAAGIDYMRHVETLSISEWKVLCEVK